MLVRSCFILVTFFIIGLANAETFSSWQSSRFTPAQLSDPAISGPAANPDADAFSNLAEYAFALQPFTINNSDEALAFSVADPASDGFLFTYTQRKNATDLFYQIEYSGDLNNPLWNLLTDPQEPNAAVDLGNVWQRTIAVPQHFSTREFLRLRLFQYPTPGQPPVLNDPPQSLSAALHPPFLDIDLTWIDRSNQETGYRIERRAEGTSTWTNATTTGSDTTSYRDHHLASNTLYHYRARAVLSSGTGSASTEASITTPLDSDGDNLSDTFELSIGIDPNNPDSDNDGLDDGYEVLQGSHNYGFADLGQGSGTPGGNPGGGAQLDPMNSDSDGNGIPDGEDDFDEDGLTNAEENLIGSEPWNAYSDGDTVIDGLDAIPTDGDIDFARSAVPHYATIELPDGFSPSQVNSSGLVVGRNDDGWQLWVAGNLLAIPQLSVPAFNLYQTDVAGAIFIDDQWKISNSQSLYNPEDDWQVVMTGISQYNGTNVLSTGETLLSFAASPWGDDTGVIRVSPGGRIFGAARAVASPYINYPAQNGQAASTAAYACNVPTYWDTPGQPIEIKGLPDNNDKAVSVPDQGVTVTVNNAKGLDDRIILLGGNSLGRIIANSSEYEGTSSVDYFYTPPINQRKHAGLLWKESTGLPISLGEKAYLWGISDLDIVVGYNGDGAQYEPSLWLETTGWKRKVIPLYENKPEDLNKVPVAINSKGLILLDYTTLWANGFTYDIAELAGQPTGTLIARQLTESGIMLGEKTLPNSQAAKNVLLLPVDITVKKKGETTSPTDGLLVKKGDILEFKLTEITQENFPIPAAQIVWYQQQLKIDGTWTDWQDIGATARGVKFEHTTAASGTFQIKAVLMDQQENAVFYNRKKDEVKSIPNDPKFKYGDGIKGQPDAIGVVDSDIQLEVCAQAKAALGTRLYASGDTVAAHGKFQAVPPDVHCNIFVAHKEEDGGAIVPLINGYLPPYDPPLANQWSGTQITSVTGYEGQEFNVALDRWRLLPANTFPQPGYVIAHPSPIGSPRGPGHTGIISYDGFPTAAGSIYVSKVRAHSLLNVSSRLRAYDPNFHESYVAGWIP